MKIAMIDPSLFTGRYDDSLCAALAGEGHNVTLMARPMRDTDAIRPEKYRYDPTYFPLSERLRARLGEGSAFRLLKAGEYAAACALGSQKMIRRADVAHVQWLPLAPADRMMLRRLQGRVPLVHTVHNAQAYHADAGVQGRGYRALLDLFDALIVHGETTVAALGAQGVERSRIHVIPHPPMQLAPASTDDLASVPDAVAPRILFFGTMRPYKGVDILIDACLALWAAGRRFELVLAGKPFMPMRQLTAPIEAAGHADKLLTDFGFLAEGRLSAHMVKADIIAFPYRQIDSSGAFLSALHHGKAMVTSDVGMFGQLPPEVASRAQSGNAQSLVQALLPLIESAAIRQQQGARSRAYGEAMGSWKDMAIATIGVYENLRAGRA